MGKTASAKGQDDTVAEAAPNPQPSQRSRWPRRLLYLAMVLLFLPSLLTVSGRIPAVLRFAHPKLAEVTTFQSVVLHWWSPVEIRQLVIHEVAADAAEITATEAGRPAELLKVESVTTKQPLWRLALNLGRNAEVVVLRPELSLVVHDGRTNLEDTLAYVFGETRDAETSTPPFSVTFDEGRLTVRSANDLVSTTLSGISGRFATSGKSAAIPDVSLTASMGESGGSPASNAADRLTLENRRNGVNPRIAATLDELAADFPLLPFDTLADDPPGDVTTSGIEFRMQPATTEGTPGQIALEAHRLSLAELQPLIERLVPGTRCSGDVSCRLQVQLLGASPADGIAGRVQIAGRDVRWRDSSWAASEFLNLRQCSLGGAFAIAEDGMLLNDLQLTSSVAELSGSGEVRTAKNDPLLKILETADRSGTANSAEAVALAEAASAGQIHLSGRIDVAQLASMLPETLSLRQGIVISEGAIRFGAKLNREAVAATGPATDGDSVRWQAAIETTPIVASDNGRRLVWESPLRADATGHLSASSWSLTRSRVAGGFGSITVDPVAGGIAVAGTVNPDRLWQDARQLLDIPRPGITEDVAVKATVTTAADRIRFTDVLLQSGNLVVSSPKLVISPARPVVEMFSGSLHIEGSGASLRTLAAPWHDADWLSPGSRVVADLVGEPDQLLRLQAQIQPPAAAFREASVYRTISTNGTTAAAASSSGFVIDQALVDVQLAIDESGQAFEIHNGRIEVPGLKALVNGAVTTPGGVLQTDLTADAEYDLDMLSRRLLQDPQQLIHLSGTGRDQFRITGAPSLFTTGDVLRLQRLNPAAVGVTPLAAQGTITWTSGQVYGLRLGPGTAVTSLENGQLRTEPIHCSVSTGEAHVMPVYDLNTSRLLLATGSRVEKIDLTPEIAREWLGYVTPLLSDAAVVKGSFSARVHQFVYDMNQPAASTIQAILTVHQAAASPGSSLAALLQAVELLQPDKSLVRDITMPAQDIAFELRNGMIIHDNAMLELAGYQLRSSGGVGLDQRIQMTLNVPLARSAGQTDTAARTIAVPVTGTLGRPQIDTAGLLQNLGTGRIQQEIDTRVKGQLDQQLNRLFDKLR